MLRFLKVDDNHWRAWRDGKMYDLEKCDVRVTYSATITAPRGRIVAMHTFDANRRGANAAARAWLDADGHTAGARSRN